MNGSGLCRKSFAMWVRETVCGRKHGTKIFGGALSGVGKRL